MKSRWQLILAAAAFLGWLAYLSYAAATKSHAPIVSHIQASAANAAVVAEVTSLDAKPKVAEKLWGDAPEGEIEVLNLSEARGFVGPGRYVLYLERRHAMWLIVGQQRSPGNDLSGVGKPLIYPWSDDVRVQAEKLKPTDAK
ncbi:MAG: hypothetical protein U0792_13755 [Gemmataceae bacterium]